MNDVCSNGDCSGEPLDGDSDSYVSDACPGGDDCDDGDSAVNPGAAEVCDDSIDDCDGDTDMDDSDCAGCTTDADCDDSNPCTDDLCDAANTCQNTNNPASCDDGDACTMNDVCSNGVCAGEPLDADSDGFVSDACPNGTDCDDGSAAVNPDADEICDDGIDNDCNGDIDGDDAACQGCPDADGDGFASDACGGTDCDDTNDAINPDAMEMCSDNVDNNCDGYTDLEDDECKRPAGGCSCGGTGGSTPALLLGLLGLLLLRRRKK